MGELLCGKDFHQSRKGLFSIPIQSQHFAWMESMVPVRKLKGNIAKDREIHSESNVRSTTHRHEQ